MNGAGRSERRVDGVMLALAAALLFGASMPAAKVLTGDTAAAWLAALLYLGVGGGFGLLSLLQLGHQRATGQKSTTRSLRFSDWPVLLPIVICGGILAPLSLMHGLRHCSASTASLLLNLEGVLSAAIAWIFFKESCNRKLAAGMLAITSGGAALCCVNSNLAQEQMFNTAHIGVMNLHYEPAAIFVVLACLGWAIDNNFSRQIAVVDLKQIAIVKGLIAATVNSILALAARSEFPPVTIAATLTLIGFLGYGASLILFVMSMRSLGTARASAYFATAPFIGAALSVIVLKEPLTMALGVSAFLMAAGVLLCLSDTAAFEAKTSAEIKREVDQESNTSEKSKL